MEDDRGLRRSRIAWLIAPVLKTGDRVEKRSVGSNPTFSAKYLETGTTAFRYWVHKVYALKYLLSYVCTITLHWMAVGSADEGASGFPKGLEKLLPPLKKFTTGYIYEYVNAVFYGNSKNRSKLQK